MIMYHLDSTFNLQSTLQTLNYTFFFPDIVQIPVLSRETMSSINTSELNLESCLPFLNFNAPIYWD